MSTKKTNAEEAEKLAKLLVQAEGHPMMKAILAEKAAATLALRQEAAGKLEALRKEQGEATPRLLADRDAKEAKYKEAKVALDTAGREFNTARSTLSIEGQSFNGRISREEQILFETADPALDEAITFFLEKLDWLRSPGRISRNARGAQSNIFTEKITRTVESNLDSVQSALQYCQSAIRALEQMKLVPELDMVKIEKMKAAIPSVDVFTEYIGDRPMPGVPPSIVPRFGGAASDEYEQTLIDRIHGKVKKVLGR